VLVAGLSCIPYDILSRLAIASRFAISDRHLLGRDAGDGRLLVRETSGGVPADGADLARPSPEETNGRGPRLGVEALQSDGKTWKREG
jgi:hypothetical protein